MELHVSVKLCTGCGDCVAVCTAGAIRLDSGIAVIDQEVCAQCQACVEACPQGAITATEMPALVPQMALVQPVREVEIVDAEPVRATVKPWLIAALAFAEQEIFPRLADALVSALERRPANKQPVKRRSKNEPTPAANNRRQGFRHRRRFAIGRRSAAGHGHGRGMGRGKWS